MQKLSFAVFFQLVAVLVCIVAYGAYQSAQAKNAVIQLSTETYPVKVACDLDMSVKSGGYDSADGNIIQAHFPMPDRCVDGREVEIHLLVVPPGRTAEEAIAEIGKVGYRPASVREFLALGSAHPDLQRKSTITTIAPWDDPLRGSMLPILSGGFGRRSLSLCWAAPAFGWCNAGPVAVVRK